MLMSWKGLISNSITVPEKLCVDRLEELYDRPVSDGDATYLLTFYVEVSCCSALRAKTQAWQKTNHVQCANRKPLVSSVFILCSGIQPNFDVGQTHGRIRHGQSWPQQPQWAPTGIIRYISIYGTSDQNLLFETFFYINFIVEDIFNKISV